MRLIKPNIFDYIYKKKFDHNIRKSPKIELTHSGNMITKNTNTEDKMFIFCN